MKHFRYFLPAIFVAAIVALTTFSSGAKDEVENDVSLEIACAIAKSGPTLLFTITNI